MAKVLFVLLLFVGGNQSATRRYYLIQQGKTWSQARAYCRSMYTDLATIENNDDMIQLQDEARRYQFSSSAWVGLWNDVNSWKWSLENEPLGPVTFWASAQPNNGEGKQECGAVKLSGWVDDVCFHPWPFVCFDANNTGTDMFVYYSTPKMWPDARSYCREHHTDLASSRNSAEYSTIMGKISETTFIGLYRDSWKWSDLTKVSNISWRPGQPDNASPNENCGFLLNGQAADGQCTLMKPFFCHKVITGRQQIFRVKVLSGLDVNNPAVKAAILKQIEQKLVEKRMEYITLKWREQPGGVVFEKEKENTNDNVMDQPTEADKN